MEHGAKIECLLVCDAVHLFGARSEASEDREVVAYVMHQFPKIG